DTGIVRLLIHRRGKVDAREDVQPNSVKKYLSVLLPYECSIIILEEIRRDRSRLHVVRIVIVLCPELCLIEILGIFLSPDVSVEAEPLTVFSLLTRPEIFTRAVTYVFKLSFEDLVEIVR